jgi:hypothetical protein
LLLLQYTCAVTSCRSTFTIEGRTRSCKKLQSCNRFASARLVRSVLLVDFPHNREA